MRALVFDSKYDTYKGVLTYVRVVDGSIEPNTPLRLMWNEKRFDPVERLAARLALDGVGSPAIQGMRDAALAEVDAGLAEAEQAPAPDPATLEDGVYAAPPF